MRSLIVRSAIIKESVFNSFLTEVPRNQSIDLIYKSINWFLYDESCVMKELNECLSMALCRANLLKCSKCSSVLQNNFLKEYLYATISYSCLGGSLWLYFKQTPLLHKTVLLSSSLLVLFVGREFFPCFV